MWTPRCSWFCPISNNTNLARELCNKAVGHESDSFQCCPACGRCISAGACGQHKWAAAAAGDQAAALQRPGSCAGLAAQFKSSGLMCAGVLCAGCAEPHHGLGGGLLACGLYGEDRRQRRPVSLSLSPSLARSAKLSGLGAVRKPGPQCHSVVPVGHIVAAKDRTPPSTCAAAQSEYHTGLIYALRCSLRCPAAKDSSGSFRNQQDPFESAQPPPVVAAGMDPSG